MREIIKHPFFNLSTSPNVPKIISPSFSDAARVIASEDLIERPILENLTTLFRKVPQREIVAQLLSEKRTWEKAFYFLLKDYQERQQEEYGHGMSFTDFTGKEEPNITDMQRKRMSATNMQMGPHGTIRAANAPIAFVDASGGNAHVLVTPLTTSQAQNGAQLIAGAQQNATPPRSKDPAVRKGVTVPLATRQAPASPKDYPPANHPPGRKRTSVSGPRTHSGVKENSPSSSFNHDDPRYGAPAIPGRSPARPRTSSTRSHANPVSTVPSTADPITSPPAGRARAYTVGAEKGLPPQFFRSPDVTGNPKSPNAPSVNSTTTPTPGRVSQSAADNVRSSDTSFVSPAPVSKPSPAPIGLGLVDVTDSPRATIDKRLSTPALDVARSSPRMLPPGSPRRDMPPPPSPRGARAQTDAANRPFSRITTVPLKSGDDYTHISPNPARSPACENNRSSLVDERPSSMSAKRRNSLLLDPITKDAERLGGTNTVGYPSPPPSQANSLEPLLALQQSPVFSERFSLHLDAMMLKTGTPKSELMVMDVDVEEDIGEDEADMATIHAGDRPGSGSERFDAGEPMDIDHEDAPLASIQASDATEQPSTSKRARADTVMTMGDWSFLGEIDEVRQAVPSQTPGQSSGKAVKNSSGNKVSIATNAGAGKRQGSGDSDKTVRPRDNAPPPVPSRERRGSKSRRASSSHSLP